MKVKSNLGEVLTKHNITRKYIADRLGITRQAVYNYVIGIRAPSYKQREYLVQVLVEAIGDKVKEADIWPELPKRCRK